MGMASSQVRLLMITNRIHDIEYKAACLQNAKILLGQLEDDAYQKFLEAQDGSNVITMGGEAVQNATLAQLSDALGVYLSDANGNVYVSPKAKTQYDRAKTIPDQAKARNAFAWYMSGHSDLPSSTDATKPTFVNKYSSTASGLQYMKQQAKIVTISDCTELDFHYEKTTDGKTEKGTVQWNDENDHDQGFKVLYGETEVDSTDTENLGNKIIDTYEDKDTGAVYTAADFKKGNVQKKSADDKLLYELVEAKAGENGARLVDTESDNIDLTQPYYEDGYLNSRIVTDTSKYKEENGQFFALEADVEAQNNEWVNGATDKSKFQMAEGSTFYSKDEVDQANQFKGGDSQYTQLYDAMYKAESDGHGVYTDNYTASQIANMIATGDGGFTIRNTGSKSASAINSASGDYGWNISIDDKNPFSYSVSTGKDETAITKASAEYENELRKIDRKEKQYDTELSKIETERQALTKEMDGLKKVIEDNVERTFGIFS